MTDRRVALLVVDLGFGDAGKGLITDCLVRTQGARLVVRFNGGAQAGHNVVTADGRQHTFSQFGAGSFVSGVKTHLARDVVVHPTALGVEARCLARVAEPDVLARLSIDPACRVTTPFQQSANRLRELRRGPARHGSCGIGFGETVQDSLNRPELTIRFGELLHPERLRDRVFALQADKRRAFESILEGDSSPELQADAAALSDPSLPDRWLRAASEVAHAVRCVSDETLMRQAEPVVFEGAQGVLLDERFGFHPHTTHSQSNFDGALRVLERCAFDGEVQRIGVLRSHAVRHGPGPLPTEDPAVTAGTDEPHNETGPWQQHVRKGWLDLVLLDYALRVAGGVDAFAVTHVDALRAFPDYLYCFAYAGFGALPVPNGVSEQAQLTLRLAAAEPLYRSLGSALASDRQRELLELIEQHGRAPVRYASYGATAGDVVSRSSVESQW